MGEIKKSDSMSSAANGSNPNQARLSMFHEYDLVAIGIPEEARPLNGGHHTGKHGYTMKSGSGAALWSYQC